MESIYLKGLKSHLPDGENAKFVTALKGGNPQQLITVDGKPASVTAVYDSNGTVYMLSLEAAVVGGSIPVDDPHEVPVPRSPQYFRSPLLRTEQYGDVIGVAAYKFVNSPAVIAGSAARTAGALS